MRSIPILMALFMMAGCVSPKPHEDSFSSIDFSRYRTVSYVVQTTDATEVASDDQGYARETVELFRVLVGQTLQRMGYTIVESGADLDLAINVTAAKPGSGAARFWVGFGAGRAVLTYSASFTEQGRKIAGFDGGEAYTGMEFSRGFASDDEIKSFAAVAGAKQVEVFMRNGGRFPAKPQPKPRKRGQIA